MGRKDQPRGGRRAPGEPADAGPGARYIWGVNPVLEALRARPDEVERLLVAEGHLQPSVAGELMTRAREAGIRVERVPRERLTTLSGGGVHQGVVAGLQAFRYAELEDVLEVARKAGQPPLLVALDGVQDPHNLGAIIRSAHALGAHGVVIPKDRAAPITGVVAKASAGALEHCAVARVTNLSRALEELKEEGLWVAAADPEGDTALWDARLDGALVLVVGAEGAGVRPGVLEHCDFRLRIPMAGRVGSLNASVSAGLLLYEVARQRGKSRTQGA